MKTKKITLQCEHGLHLRVAMNVAKIAGQSGVEVRIRCNGCPSVNACSMLQLLTLGATAGTDLEITANGWQENQGADEEAVITALAEIFEDGSGI